MGNCHSAVSNIVAATLLVVVPRAILTAPSFEMAPGTTTALTCNATPRASTKIARSKRIHPYFACHPSEGGRSGVQSRAKATTTEGSSDRMQTNTAQLTRKASKRSTVYSLLCPIWERWHHVTNLSFTRENNEVCWWMCVGFKAV
ncbi:hypothetical protein PR002_g27151 [Phytophthora rubi]|uniref:Uncharacterized protein n=1 Tax=Phytophthora rubi TaxID=129364 RepID=A0A6A3HRJ7_9STRA|nr:hypothetical protein PR002_g27151 [Phytophthora rubi]